MFAKQDISRNAFMLDGSFRKQGYDWWWHSFTAKHAVTGEEKAFLIEFFVCNPALGKDTPVFGQLPEHRRQGIRPSYLMVKVGCWGENHCQLHRFFGWNQVQIQETVPYQIQAGDCLSSETMLKGSVTVTEEEVKAHPEYLCDSGSISWDLTMEKKIAFHVGYGASRLFRKLKAFEMYWHAEGMKTLYSGTITYNGEEYRVTPESSYGYADKNWGKGFTTPWVWLSSNCLKSNLTGKELKNSVFDIGGGRPKVFFVPLNRKLLGGFYYEGEEYEFNFSKFWMCPKTEFDFSEDDTTVYWKVRQENRSAVMETEIQCQKSDMLWVNYEAPDGSKRHNRLWNGGNGIGRIRLYRKEGKKLTLIDDISASHVGCEYGEYDT